VVRTDDRPQVPGGHREVGDAFGAAVGSWAVLGSLVVRCGTEAGHRLLTVHSCVGIPLGGCPAVGAALSVRLT
jgi:hypothetical protein